MPDPMTGYYEGLPRAERVEVITSVQRRRRWSTEEKVRIVEETYLPGNSVSREASWHRGQPALHLAQVAARASLDDGPGGHCSDWGGRKNRACGTGSRPRLRVS